MAVTINSNGTITGIAAGGLPDGVVDTDTLAADAVTAAKVADNAVTTAKINADAVTAAKIADAVVNSEHLASGGVDNAHLATGVDAAKLTGALPAISGASLTGVGIGRNAIINGNFDVWQRGTSFAGVTATGYQADRWEVIPATGCTMTISRQAFTAGQTDVPNEPSYFLRADITTAGSANAEISQKIEDVRTFAGQTIMVSFYAKSTAGTQGLNCRMHQDFGSGGSTRVTTGVSVKTLSSSWQKFTFSVALGSISGKTIGTGSYLAFNFYWANNSTSNDVDLAQVKVEKGSIATDFEPKSYGEELKLCQRYYYAHIGPNQGSNQLIGKGAWNSAAQFEATVHFKETMRTTATLVTVSGTNYYRYHGRGTSAYISWVNIHAQQSNCASLYTTITGTLGLGANLVCTDAAAYVHFNAEL